MRWRSALHCLPYDVEVLTESGYIPIGTLVDTNAVGKQVYTISSKGKFILKPIKEVHISGTSDRMVKLYLSNGKTVECTYNHRFLTVNGIYKMAKELEGCNLVGHSITSFRVVGSNLELTHTRPWVRVLSVDYLEGSQDVYELTIDEETPCFILGCGLISHNTIPTGSSIKNIFTSRYLGGSIMAPDYCLSGDTLVKLTNGEDVKIEDLVGRDEFYVYSYDENKREVVVGRGHDCRPVVKPESMLKLTLDTGEIIKCTREHQFYLYAIGFTESRYLKVGSQLKSIKGFSEITEIEEIEGEQTYCFTVDEFHNFYLTSKVLSHNSQMEVRSIAAAAHEESMLAAFKSGADIHRMNACFTYDTRVITLSGPVKIGDLAKDYEEWYDKSEFKVPVVSYDIENDKMVVAYATHPRKVETNSKLLKLTFRSGVVVKCTDDHRFLNSNNQWIPAYMTLGVLVRTPSLVGEYDKVETIQNISSEDVYDITVDKYENFLVSDGNCKKKVIVTLEDSPKTMPDNITSYARSELEISYGVVAHNSQVWKKPPEDITDAERRFSKMVTFAILYGADYHNIANNFMDGDIDAAKDLLDRFYGAFPKLKSWIDQMQNLWKSTGYVTLITNRIIKIRKPDKFDKKYKYKYSKALRQSQNFPIN